MQAAGRRSGPALARGVAVCLLVAQLAGCSDALRWEQDGGYARPVSVVPAESRPAVHVVARGETLYSIAFRYGLDYRQVALWNGLGDGSLIRVGQRLRLQAPQTAARAAPAPPESPRARSQAPQAPRASAPPRWGWPTNGPIRGRYGESPMTASGIQIGGQLGQAVHASAAGRVVYSGTGLAGYGALLILRHDDTWLSAYGYNSTLLVREGDEVRAGQRIASVGEGPGRVPMLHFEIRRSGTPVDPMALLPRR